MSVAIIDKNADWRKLQITIKQMEKVVLKVGIQANAGVNAKGVSVAEYGAYNEYGTYTKQNTYKKHSSIGGLVKIPARSFIRSTADENDGWKADMDKAFERILLGNTVNVALTLAGKKIKNDIIDKLKMGDPSWKPLSEATKKKKKSDKPLFDTGFLRKSINYQISYEFGNK